MALKLYELGFNDNTCYSYYTKYKELLFEIRGVIFDNDNQDRLLAPTFSHVFEWLEKKYFLFLCRDVVTTSNEVLNINYWVKSLSDKWNIEFEPYVDLDSYESKLICLNKILDIIKNN
jgi:hypothetical protein